MLDHGDQTCVYTWGNVDVTGHNSEETVPRVLEAFDGTRVLQVRCSNGTSLALTANGRVWRWGIKNSPKKVKGLKQIFIQHIALTTPGRGDESFYHCALIADNNELYMFGNNINQQIERSDNETIMRPTKVMEDVKDVACGDRHTIAVLMNGDVVCWGDMYDPDKVILAGKDVVKVAAGGFGFCGALTADHTLYTWTHSRGVSEGDFLGRGRNGIHSISTPEPVLSLLNNCGWIHTAAVTLNGDLYTWGEGDTDRLGLGTSSHSSRHKHTPTLVNGMQGTNVVRLSLSRGNEGAVSDIGNVYTWGGSDHGGHHLHSVPTLLPLNSTFFQGAEIQDLACGKRHTVVVLRMQRSLQYLCFRAILNHFDSLLDKIALLPEELREAIASFMNDRRHWTKERALALASSLSPLPSSPSPASKFIFSSCCCS